MFYILYLFTLFYLFHFIFKVDFSWLAWVQFCFLKKSLGIYVCTCVLVCVNYTSGGQRTPTGIDCHLPPWDKVSFSWPLQYARQDGWPEGFHEVFYPIPQGAANVYGHIGLTWVLEIQTQILPIWTASIDQLDQREPTPLLGSYFVTSMKFSFNISTSRMSSMWLDLHLPFHYLFLYLITSFFQNNKLFTISPLFWVQDF